MASTKLTRTNGTSTNLKNWTWSAWIKRGIIGTQETFAVSRYDDSNYSRIRTDPDVLQFEDRFSSVTYTDIKSTRVLRDPHAWYHIVVRIDYTQSSAADRARMYVNGTEVTYATTTRQSQDGNSYFNESVPHALGHYNDNNYFHGCMSHVHFTDGYSYAPTEFGETDSTTGQWKIKTSPSVTYGNNGYFILKDANGVTDQSGNSNNFTVGSGTLTTLQDNPSNNFSTLSPIIRTSGGAFSQVANTFTDTSGSYQTGFSSQGMLNGQGKYYAEFKVVSGSSLIFGIADYKDGGIIDRIQQGQTRYLGEYSNAYGYQSSGRFYYNGSSTTTDYTSFTTNDIIGLAVDMDNLIIYWHKNGTYQGAADPASNNGYTIVAPEEAYHMGISSASSVANANFGNGIFGTTAISSEGTNASGEGKFEYDVPSGYTALCTKGLNL